MKKITNFFIFFVIFLFIVYFVVGFYIANSILRIQDLCNNSEVFPNSWNANLDLDNIKEEKLPESPIIEHLRDFWKEDEIEIVQKIYEYMVSLNDTDNQIYLKIIETLLEEKEKKIYSYIQKVSTSYE